jgi:hypothetical protein
MDEKQKREALKRVPTRKLLASIKEDLRKIRPGADSTSKPKKAK